MNGQSIALLGTLVVGFALQTPAVASPGETSPPAGDDTLVVKMNDSSKVKTIGLICSEGSHRSDQALSDSVATFSQVPSGYCTLEFKGETPSTFTPMYRANTYQCTIIGQTAVCK